MITTIEIIIAFGDRRGYRDPGSAICAALVAGRCEGEPLNELVMMKDAGYFDSFFFGRHLFSVLSSYSGQC